MTKELEAFRDILGILSAVSGCEVDMNSERVRIVKSALQRLEAIENANPSEALEEFYALVNAIVDDSILKLKEPVSATTKQGAVEILMRTERMQTIKQALIKAQEQEKEMAIKELVSKGIIDHNSVVHVFVRDKNDPHYSIRIFVGMAWEMEKHNVGNRKLKRIFSALAETISESDRVCIEVE